MVELRQHPAQARHPVTNDPLFDEDGNPRPLLPDQRAVYWDDICIGYASKHGVAFTIEVSQVPEWLQVEVGDLVEAEFGTCPKMTMLVDSDPEVRE